MSVSLPSSQPAHIPAMTPHPVHRRKKLIEVAIPLAAINAASAREKSIRHGHPSTLHLWWARRPLAAARAVIFCQMVDDPSAVPEEFPKCGTLVIPVGLLLEVGGGAEEAGPDAAARKHVELLAMNAVFEAEKALGRMPRDVSAQRGIGYDIESMDDQGDLFFIEVKGRVDGANSVTLTINEVNTGRNSPHRFRLALVTVTSDQAASPVYVRFMSVRPPDFALSGA